MWEQIWIAIGQEFSDLGSVGDITRVLMRMTLAVLLGGLLGYERESASASAGLRTHAGVARLRAVHPPRRPAPSLRS